MNFIFRTDTHVADKGPESWKGDYPAEIWSNLEQIGAFARKYRAEAVLDGGDYFHVKAPTRNSHALVAKTAEIHATYPCPVFCIEGNHDMVYNNLDSIERQPLGVLYASGVFQHLREHVFESDGIRTRVVGVPYSPFRTLEELRKIRKQPGDTFLIAVVHALAGKNPPAHVEEFFNEPVFRYSDLVFDDGPDVWAFGHWHRDQGIECIDGRFFVNQGAVSRGALSKENLERIPKVALIELCSSGVTVGALELKVAPASEVFDLEKKERLERESDSIEEFVRTIQASAAVDPAASIEDAMASCGDFARDVHDLAREYLEAARAKARR